MINCHLRCALCKISERRTSQLIEVKNLTKKYGSSYAVKNISFTIESGHIYGFLGPNGAGKSTTMNIITGCLAATAGDIKVSGHDIYEEAVAAKKCIGYLPEIPPVYADMTPVEYLEFVAEAKGVAADELEKSVDEVIELTGLDEMANRLIKNLSKGYKQRVGIAQALLGDPEIIILDEPTVGLDPLQIIEIRDLIKELGKKHTVILSSHILSEIKAVCDRVIIISHGRIVADATLDELENMYGKTNIIKIESRGDAQKLEAALKKVSGIKTVRVTPRSADIYTEIESVEGRDVRDGVFKVYSELGFTILSMTSDYLTLENIFINLTSNDEFDDDDERDDEPSEKNKHGDPLGGAYLDEEKKNGEEQDDYKPMFSNEEDED